MPRAGDRLAREVARRPVRHRRLDLARELFDSPHDPCWLARAARSARGCACRGCSASSTRVARRPRNGALSRRRRRKARPRSRRQHGRRPAAGMPNRRVLRRHESVLARVDQLLPLPRPARRRAAAWCPGAEAAHLRTDRRHRCRADHVAARNDRRHAGTTATVGFASPRSRSTRWRCSATATRRAAFTTSCWQHARAPCPVCSRCTARRRDQARRGGARAPRRLCLPAAAGCAVILSWRCRPSGLAMNLRRDGSARYPRRCARPCRAMRSTSKFCPYACRVRPSSAGAASRMNQE